MAAPELTPGSDPSEYPSLCRVIDFHLQVAAALNVIGPLFMAGAERPMVLEDVQFCYDVEGAGTGAAYRLVAAADGVDPASTDAILLTPDAGTGYSFAMNGAARTWQRATLTSQPAVAVPGQTGQKPIIPAKARVYLIKDPTVLSTNLAGICFRSFVREFKKTAI